jgi:chemotaxis protein histidine kinase CheA
VQITKQQQILGYFIEEAKEHLDSIEHGLLNLKSTMADAEEMNQMFRAAHSIKGGAAMLGFNSIQRVSHHLEDYFKLLKDNSNVNIDHKLEDLFLKGFDGLKALIEQLQSTFGLRDEDADKIVKSTEPIFAELRQYLNLLIKGGSAPIATPQSQHSAKGMAAGVATGAADQVTKILKVMLQLFKQGDNPKSRHQLATLCTRLMQLSPKNPHWVGLGQSAQRAIVNPAAPYNVLAPLIIKELKQASDLLLAGRGAEIIPSNALKQLAQAKAKVPAVAAAPAAAAAANPEPTMMTSIRPRTIVIPAEPKAAARALLDAFNKNELIQLAEFLMKAIQA